MKKTLYATLLGLVIILPTGPALADPNLPNARAHKHFIVTPNGNQVQVGPDLCSDPNLQEAFNQFHFNVHHSGTPFGHIDTLGPQDGAPGLHNDRGAELLATIC